MCGLDGRLEVEYFAPAPERDVERAWQQIDAMEVGRS